jgi:hypothetical protein
MARIPFANTYGLSTLAACRYDLVKEEMAR